MDKLTTLLACLPKSPFKDNLTEEIESLRQQLVSVTKERDEIAAQARMLDRMVDERGEQLAAALSACEAKDTILRGITLYRAFNGDDWPAIEATQALAIKPDAFTLRQHDEALIERCAEVCEEYVDRIEAKRDEEYQAEYAGRQAGATRCAAAIRELKSEN